jgi:hypothetical protein
MQRKKIVKMLLLAFVAISAVFLFLQSFVNRAGDESCKDLKAAFSDGPMAQIKIENENQDSINSVSSCPDDKPVTSEKSRTTDVVYYFLTNVRCPTCMKIETYTKETVDRNFKKELETGEMIWVPVNLDKPEYRHFINDFQLAFKTVVIARVGEGNKVSKWKNLDKVWEVVGDKEVFMSYISDEIKKFREGM